MKIKSEQSDYKWANYVQPGYGSTEKSSPTGLKRKENAGSVQDGISLSISKEGIGLLQEQDEAENKDNESVLFRKSDEEAMKQAYQEQVQDSKKAAEAYRDLGKIMEIARRISNGDRVPSTDEKKLMEFSSDLYQTAKAAAIINEDKKHKDYESLFEEEDEEDVKSKMRDLEREQTAAGEETVSETTELETLDMAAEQ